MTTKKPALVIDEMIALDINGSKQRVRLCAARTGLPPLVVVQHGPGVPVLHEVAKFQRALCHRGLELLEHRLQRPPPDREIVEHPRLHA